MFTMLKLRPSATGAATPTLLAPAFAFEIGGAELEPPPAPPPPAPLPGLVLADRVQPPFTLSLVQLAPRALDRRVGR